MARGTASLEGRDVARAQELARHLRVLAPAEGSALGVFVPELRLLLESDHAIAYHYVPEGHFAEVDLHVTAGAGGLFDALPAFFRTVPDAHGPFRFDRAPVDQHNRPVRTYEELSDEVREIPLFRSYFCERRLDRLDQLRVLVADGGEWLAYVGAFRPGLYGAREMRLLELLVPALKERLVLERTLGQAPMREAAFEAAFEAIGRPAFVLRRAGSSVRLLHANGAGRSALAREEAGAWDELVRSVLAPGADAPFQVTGLVGRGVPGALLCVRREGAVSGERLVRAQEAWQLTPRQAQVLALLARGRSNKAIGAELGCTEGTVELHVTALLHKSQSDSRAALVARFWSEL